MSRTMQMGLTALYWLASAFCLAWVAIFWGKGLFLVGLTGAVVAAATVRSSGSDGKATVAWRAAADLLAVGLLSFGWVHLLVRFVMNI